MDLGERIKYERQKRGLSQRRLAEFIDSSSGAISFAETNKIGTDLKGITAETANRILAQLSRLPVVEPIDLLGPIRHTVKASGEGNRIVNWIRTLGLPGTLKAIIDGEILLTLTDDEWEWEGVRERIQAEWAKRFGNEDCKNCERFTLSQCSGVKGTGTGGRVRDERGMMMCNDYTPAPIDLAEAAMLAEKIRHERKRRGLFLVDAASLVGVHKTTLGNAERNYEQKGVSYPKLQMRILKRISKLPEGKPEDETYYTSLKGWLSCLCLSRSDCASALGLSLNQVGDALCATKITEPLRRERWHQVRDYLQREWDRQFGGDGKAEERSKDIMAVTTREKTNQLRAEREEGREEDLDYQLGLVLREISSIQKEAIAKRTEIEQLKLDIKTNTPLSLRDLVSGKRKQQAKLNDLYAELAIVEAPMEALATRRKGIEQELREQKVLKRIADLEQVMNELGDCSSKLRKVSQMLTTLADGIDATMDKLTKIR